MLKGIQHVKDRFGIIGEIRENTGIVPGGAGSYSGYFNRFKIIFNNVLLFN